MKFFWQKPKHPKTRGFADYAKESYEELSYEHRLITQTLAQLSSGKSMAIMGNIRQDVRAQVHANLLARKVEIELLINSLQEAVNT